MAPKRDGKTRVEWESEFQAQMRVAEMAYQAARREYDAAAELFHDIEPNADGRDVMHGMRGLHRRMIAALEEYGAATKRLTDLCVYGKLPGD